MEASVGPYRLCSSAPKRAKKRACSSKGNASPLQMTRFRLWPRSSSPGSSKNCWSIEGTKCKVVICSAAMRAAR